MFVSASLLLLLLLQAGPAAPRAVITGQVSLIDGMPAAAVRVVAIPAPPPNVRPAEGQNYYASQAPVSAALTDNSGRYRLANLPAGRFFVVAGLIGHGTFYPSTTDIDAATVLTTTAGETLEGVDLRMRTSPGALLRGRINPPPFPDTPERAVLSGVGVGDLTDVPVREDGRFEFGRIPAGEYFVSFIPHPPGMRGVAVRIQGSDIAPIEVTRPPVRTVSGRIVTNGGRLPLVLLGFVTGWDYVRALVHPDGTFSVRLHDAPYEVAVDGMPVGYRVSAIRAGSRVVTGTLSVPEAADSGIVIEITSPTAVPASSR